MKKPDWKVALAGGAVAGLALGGFTIAQADQSRPSMDTIDLNASAGSADLFGSLASPTSTTTTILRSLDSPSTASIDSVDVAPAPAANPAPTPAPAPRADYSVDSIDSPDSVSVASYDSPASVSSIDSISS